MANFASTYGQRYHTGAGGLGEQRRWSGWPRNVGLLGGRCRASGGELSSTKWGGLNVNYPLWEDPGELEGVGLGMRARLQAMYDEKDLGALPSPQRLVGGDESHLEVLLRVRPEGSVFIFFSAGKSYGRA